jgi:hypothetical protein
MKKYAVLNNESTVDNIIVASDLTTAEKVTNSYCALIPSEVFVDIGYTYVDGAFSAPVAE